MSHPDRFDYEEARRDIRDNGGDPDYLSDGYFAAFSNVVDRAAELGMNVWLYDEGGWPSGGACGQIAAADRDGRFRKRFFGRGDGDGPLAVRASEYGKGGASYPSIIEKGATEEFLRRTHQQYRRDVGHHFGKAIKFTFMDEPAMPQNFFGANLGWTSDFEDAFLARKGYGIRKSAERLLDSKYTFDASIVRERIDYFDVMADLFVERFMEPIRRWDAANGLKSSGHLNGEDVPEWTCQAWTSSGGSFFRRRTAAAAGRRRFRAMRRRSRTRRARCWRSRSRSASTETPSLRIR